MIKQEFISDIPLFRPSLFWDVDRTGVSLTKHKDFVIRRVFDRGTWDEILDMVAIYGEDTAKASLLQAPSLNRGSLFLASRFFHVKQEDFLCYNTKRSLMI